ncbi:MAG: beta-ketoacyl-ACP synthase III [Planctomycetota bacterium]
MSGSQTSQNAAARPALGTRILGTGVAIPSRTMTNQDLEKVMDTSDEWIVQRTGIRSRVVVDTEKGEDHFTLGVNAVRSALAAAKVNASELDLIILATMSNSMNCPATANRIGGAIGAGDAGSFDLVGACCGFVYSMNVADALIRTGQYRTVAVVGSDTLSRFMSYDTNGRGTAILFGDAAGSAILRATDDASKGVLAQEMHADGERWQELYVPERKADFPSQEAYDEAKLHRVQMNGQAVFKFAVGTFPKVIEQTLEKAGLAADDVDHYVCHQSNLRILHAARDRFGLADHKLHTNIDRFGNTVAASVPLVLQDLINAGRVEEGQKIMLVGFGGGLTWGTSLWQL